MRQHSRLLDGHIDIKVHFRQNIKLNKLMKIKINRHCVGYQFNVKEFGYILVTYKFSFISSYKSFI